MTMLGRIVALPLACLIACPASAAEWFAGIAAVRDDIEIGNENFNPILAELQLGVVHETGWGAELLIGQGVNDDDAANVTMEVDLQSTLFITYTNNFYDEYEVWLGAGYSYLELNSELGNTGFPGSEDFHGTSFEIGASDHYFQSIPNLSISGSFRQLFDEDEVSVRAFSLGVRYDF